MRPVRRATPALATTLGLAAATGVLLWLASPTVGIAWLAWFAIVPAAIVPLRHPGTRLARLSMPLALGVYMELLLIPAFPFGLTEDQYGDPPVPILVGDSPVLVIAIVVVPVVIGALYAIGFPYLVPLGRGIVRSEAVVFVVAPVLAWVALDLVRTKFDPGGFWGPLFLAQHDAPTSWVSVLVGPWLLTALIALAGFTLAYLLVRGRPAVAFAAGAAGFAATVTVVAAIVLAVGGGRSEPLRVAAVQPGYDTAEFDLPVNHFMRRVTRDHERASLDLIGDLTPLTLEAADRGAELIVWPEAVVWVDPHDNQPVQGELTAIAAQTDATLVVPYFIRSADNGAAVVVTPDGSVSAPFPKQRPMWFLGENGNNRVPPATVDTPVGRLGTMLGVDNQDPRSPRDLVNLDATLISSSTHDWRQLAPEQTALSQLHSRSLNVPIVRADWRFGSAIIDSDGRLVADAGRDQHRVVLVADVQPSAGTTPYARVGDVLGWAVVAFVAAAWVLLRLPRRWLSGTTRVRASA